MQGQFRPDDRRAWHRAVPRPEIFLTVDKLKSLIGNDLGGLQVNDLVESFIASQRPLEMNGDRRRIDSLEIEKATGLPSTDISNPC